MNCVIYIGVYFQSIDPVPAFSRGFSALRGRIDSGSFQTDSAA